MGILNRRFTKGSENLVAYAYTHQPRVNSLFSKDMAITASQIANWLRVQRGRAGLSQGEAGKKAGLNPDAISKWERGERGIMAENFVALVLAYDVDVRSIEGEPLPTELLAPAPKRMRRKRTR